MDVAGEQQNGLAHDIVKMRLDPNGAPIGDAYAHTSVPVVVPFPHHVHLHVPTSVAGSFCRLGEAPEEHAVVPADYCGPCYGAQTRGDSQCCNTCDDVRAA
jgi:hypothetical protein